MTRSRPIPTQPLRRRGVRGRLVLTSALGGCMAVFAALPAGAQVPVVAATGRIDGAPTGVLPGLPAPIIGVTRTGTVIDWASFNIGDGATVQINDARLPGNTSTMTMLNRVVGPGASQINGTLTGASTIAVYIVNPAGVVFGGNAAVNVGSLIASTISIDPDQFIAGNYAFTAPANAAGVTVGPNVSLRATGLPANLLGHVALIGARVDSAGTIAASGDVALVAATDVTLTYDAANPLSFTVREGTALGTVTAGGITTNGPMVVSGTIGGRSALFVAATRQAVTDAVLDINAAVTATSALATDRGIVLIAGRNPGTDARVTFAAASPANDGVVSLALGAQAPGVGLSATGAGGAIGLTASGGITAGSGGSPIASLLTADQGITARALTGGIVLGDVTGGTVALTADAGDMALGDVEATGGPLRLTATAGALTAGELTATGNITALADLALAATSAETTAGALSLTSNTDTLSVATTESLGATTLAGATATRVNSATTGAAGDLTITGGALSGIATGSRSSLTVGRDLSVTVGGAALIGTAAAGRAATIGAASVDATTVSATTGAIAITATAGDLTAGTVTATGNSVRLTANAGLVSATDVTGSTSVRVDARATTLGTVAATGTTLDITTTDPAGTLGLTNGSAGTTATLRAAGDTAIGALTGATVLADATGALVATTLGATGALTGIGGRVDVGTATAGTALSLTSRTTGALRLGGGSAGGTTLLDAGGALTLTGTYTGTGAVQARSGGVTTLNTLNSTTADTQVTAGGSLTATRLTAGTALTVLAPDFTIGSVQTGTGAATLTAQTGAAVLGSATAIGTDLLIGATNGSASVTGAVTATRDYSVTARSVSLGSGTAATQAARRNVAITSSGGDITGAGLLVLRADDAGNGVGTLVLDATGGNIAFAGSSRLMGGNASSGDIGIRLGTPGGTLALGRVEARALLSVDAGHTVFSPLATDGTIDLNGAVTLDRTFQATSSGDILTQGITVNGGGQGIALTTTGAGSDVNVRGLLNAAGGVAVTARDTIAFTGAGDVTARGGDVVLRATDGAITGLAAVTATGLADVRAGTDLSLASLVSGTDTAAADRSAYASGRSVSIGTATAGSTLTLVAAQGPLLLGNGSAGTSASLTKTGATGDLRVTGTLLAGAGITATSDTDALVGTLRTTAGAIGVTVGGLAQATTLDAGSAITVAAGDPASPTSAGAIRIGTATARGGALDFTAANRAGTATAGIVLTSGSAVGPATLTTIGSGDIVATTLSGTTTTLGSAGNARLGDVRATAGTLTATAAGALTGLVRATGATDGRLASGFDGATLVATGDVVADAGGLVQVGTVTGDALAITAGGDAGVLGDVTAGRRYAVTGNAVTLGLTAVPVTQTATGAIEIVSRAGALTGRSGLSLASDRDGNGGDLILRSGAGIDFADGTTLRAGGTGRVSAVRVAAASGSTLRLDRVDARSLVSYDAALTATSLRHDGPVLLGTITVRDALDLGTTGALTAGTLISDGALDVSGTTVTIGTARAGTSAALRSTGGTLDVALVNAANGALGLDAIGDLRLGTATATGAIDAGATGDITGRTGFAAATLTSSGGAVTVATRETDGTKGVVQLASVTGRTGVTLAGRFVTADSLASANGGITVTSRRNAANVATTGITVAAIDALGDVLVQGSLGTANPDGTGAVALGGATSRTGAVTVTSADGGIAGLSGGRADLSAATAILVDASGPARLGTLGAGSDLTVAAQTIDLLAGTAGTGALALTARDGDLVLGSGTAATDATLRATGAMTITTLDAGRDATLVAGGPLSATTLTAGRALSATSSGDLTLGTGTAGGDATLSAAGLATITDLTSSGAIGVTANSIDAGALGAGTTLTTASTADSRFGTLTSGGDTGLTAGTTLAIGSLTAGRDAGLTVGGALTATTLTAARDLSATMASGTIDSAAATTGALSLTATTGDLTLRTGTAGTDATLSAAGLVTITDLTGGGAIGVAANRIDAGTIGAGARLTTASTADSRFGTLTSGGDTSLTAGTTLAIGSLTAGRDAGLTVGGALTATTLTAARDLTAAADSLGIDAATATAGAVRLTATGLATLGTTTSGTTTDLRAGRIDATNVTVGTVLTTRSDADSRFGSIRTGGDASLTAGTTLAIGTLDVGGALALTAGGALDATTLIAARDLTVSAASLTIDSATATTGTLRLTATTGDLTLARGRAGAAAILSADNGALTAGARDGLVAGTSIVTSGRAVALTGADAGTTLTASAGSGGLSVTGGSATGAVALTSGGTAGFTTVTSRTAGIAIDAVGAVTGGSATAATALAVTGASVDLGTAVATTGPLTLTARTGDLTLADGRTGGTATLAASNGVAAVTALTSGGAMDIRASRIAAGSIDAGGTLTIASTADTRLTAGMATGDAAVTAGTTLAIATLASRTGAIAATAGNALSADSLVAATTIGATGNSVTIGTATARGGALTATARSGDLTLATGNATGPVRLTADSGLATVGTLTSGGATDIRANRIAAGSIDAGGTLAIASTGDTRLTTGTATGDATLTAGTTLAIGTLTSRTGAIAATAGNALTADSLAAATTIGATGGSVAIGTAIARGGALTATARSGDLMLTTGTATGPARLTATNGVATIGTLTGSSIDVTAAAVAATDLTAGTTLAIASTRDLRLAGARSGGDASLTAGGAATIGNLASDGAIGVTANREMTATTLDAAGDLTATAATLAIGTGTARGGALGLTASAGDLTLGTGMAGRAATLSAGGSIGIGTLTAATAVTLRAAQGLTATNVTATGGALTVTTGADARLDTASAGGDAGVTSGGAIGIGTLIVAGSLRTLATGATTATTLTAGQDLTATGRSVAIGSATARRGALALTATGGDLGLGTGAAATDATMLATGGTARIDGDLTAGGNYAVDAAAVTLGTAASVRQSAGNGVTIAARTGAITGGDPLLLTAGAGGIRLTARDAVALAAGSTLRTAGGDVAITAGTTAALGSVSASGRAITLSAQDATLAGALTATTIGLTNTAAAGVTRLGDLPTDNRAEFDQGSQRFDLSTAEVARMAADTIVVDSRGLDVRTGALALDPATGRTRFEVRTSGRLDVLGRLTAPGSTTTRQIVLGGDGSVAANGAGGRASVIRVAATQAGGGRLLVGDATLDLRAARIGVGLDGGFLATIGFVPGGTPLDVDQVASRFVAQPTSTLYAASTTGQPLYTDRILLSARSLVVRYSQYALFQNTGRAGETLGAVLGTTPAAPTSGALQLVANGGAIPNAFALFGTVNGIGNTATSLLGGDAIAVDGTVSRTNSRANGCVIGSAGGGCLSSSITQPTLNIFDASRSEIFRTADDLSLPFDPLVGTNNESLFSDIGGYVPSTVPTCGTPNTAPCPPVGDPK